jgi:hypothetical protein
LLDLSGLISVTIGSLFAVKALRMTWNVSKNNVFINGNANSVNIYNHEMAGVQKSFQLLWNVLVVVVICTYPKFGTQYNSVLKALVLFAPLVSVVAYIVTLRGFGFSRLFDGFYIFGAFAAAWISYCSTPYLANAAASSQHFTLLPDMFDKNGADFWRYNYLASFVEWLAPAFWGLFGFVLLFLSAGFLTFGFLTHRSFDGALRYTIPFLVASLIGYLLIGGAFTNHSFQYLMALIKNLFSCF